LAGAENFSDQLILTLDDKGQQEAVQGVWLYEIGDLAGMGRADVERVKAFASRKVDRARPAYGRTRVDRARRCVFFASTNDDTYLLSQTGNRRFWPVRVGRIDLAALARDRDQLWAEAVAIERSGISLTLPERLWSEAASEQETRQVHDSWIDILAHVQGRITEENPNEYRVTSAELFGGHLNLTADRISPGMSKRLGYVMRRLKWQGPRVLKFDGNKPARGYFRAKDAVTPDAP
jgi:predicted P-loop ATPase